GDPDETVSETIAVLAAIEIAEQLLTRDMAQDGDVRARRRCRTVLGQCPKVARVPGSANHRRERVAVALEHAQGTGELGLDHEQALVVDAGVALDQLAMPVGAAADALVLRDRVAHTPDQPLARAQSLDDVRLERLLGHPQRPRARRLGGTLAPFGGWANQ